MMNDKTLSQFVCDHLKLEHLSVPKLNIMSRPVTRKTTEAPNY